MTMYLAISTALAWDTVGLNTAPCAAQERASAHAPTPTHGRPRTMGCKLRVGQGVYSDRHPYASSREGVGRAPV